jgi:hypothetical protein
VYEGHPEGICYLTIYALEFSASLANRRRLLMRETFPGFRKSVP